MKFFIFAALTALALTACEQKKQDHAHGEGHDHDHAHDAKGAAAETSAKAPESQGAHDHAHHDHAHHDHGAPDNVPADQKVEGKTERGEFFVKVTPTPNPIPFQELFAMEIEIFDGEDQSEALEGASIDQVRALMPAHNHGMKVEPKITRLSPNKFKVEGMRFHMQGAGDDGKWVLEAVVNHDGKIDKTNFALQCCRQKAK